MREANIHGSDEQRNKGAVDWRLEYLPEEHSKEVKSSGLQFNQALKLEGKSYKEVLISNAMKVVEKVEQEEGLDLAKKYTKHQWTEETKTILI